MTKYRMSIFGLAVIWIFFRHTFYYNQVSFSFLSPIVQIGDCGVDVFLFLSGFGLYFSYTKYLKKIDFYKKRVLRIIPAVIILLSSFAILKDLLQGLAPTTIFYPRYWFLSVYSNYWFIGAILLFYALYPFIICCVRKSALLTTIIAFVLSVAGISCVHFLNAGLLGQLVVYFARFPVFILGAVFAHHLNLLTYSKSIIVLMFLSIPCLIYFPKDFQRLMYFPLATAVCVVLPQFLDKMPPIFAKTCSFFGRMSLEFYLIHVFLFGMGFIGWLNAKLDIYVCILLAFIAATMCSYLSSLVISSITKRICR